eukprot:6318646-Prymnesium_polylepis.2
MSCPQCSLTLVCATSRIDPKWMRILRYMRVTNAIATIGPAENKTIHAMWSPSGEIDSRHCCRYPGISTAHAARGAPQPQSTKRELSGLHLCDTSIRFKMSAR